MSILDWLKAELTEKETDVSDTDTTAAADATIAATSTASTDTAVASGVVDAANSSTTSAAATDVTASDASSAAASDAATSTTTAVAASPVAASSATAVASTASSVDADEDGDNGKVAAQDALVDDIDPFLEKLKGLLEFAGHELGHVWYEAVDFAKKLA